MKLAMILHTFFFFLVCFSHGIIGLPKQDESYAYYNEQEYKDDYDYGDEDTPSIEVEGAATILTHRPVIISEPINTDVDNGMTIRLPCIVDKLPGEIPIIWRKEDEKKTIIAMGSRIIEPEYQERATVIVDENGRMGSPKPTIIWSRIGNKMPDGSQKTKSDSLHFSDVTREHVGTYKCTASNENGQGVSKLIEVVINHAPKIEVSDSLVLAKSGNSAKLVCSITAYPSPKVVWYKGDKRIRPSDRVTMESLASLHSLTVQDIQTADFGNYMCKASNSLGSEETVMELSGFAKQAEFTSSASGSSENTFLIEWSSKSMSIIEEFILEVATSPSGNWAEYSIKPSAVEGYEYAGKHFLSDLQPATPYKARVKSRNSEGWGSHSNIWNFTTKGAVPSPASVTASAALASPTIVVLLINATLFFLRLNGQ